MFMVRKAASARRERPAARSCNRSNLSHRTITVSSWSYYSVLTLTGRLLQYESLQDLLFPGILRTACRQVKIGLPARTTGSRATVHAERCRESLNQKQSFHWHAIRYIVDAQVPFSKQRFLLAQARHALFWSIVRGMNITLGNSHC